MNKKGFTLVELMGVIVVLAVIVGIGGLSVITIINKSRNKLYGEMRDTLKDSAITYAVEKAVETDISKTFSVTVKKLIDGGFFKDDKGYCNKTTVINVVYNENTKDYIANVADDVCSNK